MKDIRIDRFETKPEFVSDLADFDNSKAELYIRANVKNRHLLNELNIEKLWLIGAKEKDIEQIFSIHQPKHISFYQFLAKDLSCLESLNKCETLIMEWNTKATELWNFKSNLNLSKLAIRDFSKISDLSLLEKATQIKSLSLDGGMDKKLKVDTLKPLSKLPQLEFLRLTNIQVSDESLEPISNLGNLKILELSNQFPTIEYAKLAAKLVNTKCAMFNAYQKVEFKKDGILIYDTMITGKRKPFLLSTKDQSRIEKYKKEFEKLKITTHNNGYK
ncbi:hypothetical protein JL193_09355 [Polaribacter batillariae]|uniref:Internalin n=1 Tax=Polaribacter batillariae TaxID=2808900 RepID=A0ABX7SQ64_9FLAO|nr:hypothetical protein [Polaribacter batillariae]QTD36367.1 hypothetical protein JL193_09355 [Polaribacter batillariae]